MSGWRKVRLNELGTVERGRSRHRPRNDPKLYGGPYPFVQTGDVKAAGLRLTECDQNYSADGLAQSRLWPVGTLCITIAANIGDTTILGLPACFPDSIVGFTPYPGVSDVVFVKYMLDLVKQHFTSISSGATQDNLSIEKLLSQDLWAPAIDEQCRIASILGAYDDLIEVNRRRVAVLEAMARGLFEEWFVRFRFPGHEHYKVIETPDGPLPEGWNWQDFGSFASDVREPVSPSAVSPETRYVGLEHIPRRSTTLDSYGRADEVGSLKLRFYRGDVLFGKIRPYFHKVAWAPYEGVSSSDAIVFRAKRENYQALTLLVASSDEFIAKAVQTSNGTKMPRANPSVLRGYKVASGGEAFASRFNDVAMPSIELAALLQTASETLAAARDLLLPRLISGDLSIAVAERELEAAA